MQAASEGEHAGAPALGSGIRNGIPRDPPGSKMAVGLPGEIAGPSSSGVAPGAGLARYRW